MNDFFKCLGEAAKDRISSLSFWQVFVLTVAIIFALAAAKHYFPQGYRTTKSAWNNGLQRHMA